MAKTAKDVLTEILSDKAQFADNFVVTLANGQVLTLGDMRSLSAEQQTAIAKREELLATRTRELEENMRTLQLAQGETARMYADLVAKGAEGGDRKVDDKDPLDDKLNDPLLGPIVTAIKNQRDAMLKLHTDVLAPLNDTIRNMAKSFVTDRVTSAYETLVPEASRKDYGLDRLLKHANDGKMLTASGFPDIRKAYIELTTKPMSQGDLDKLLADAKAAGRKEADEAARIRVPRPGVGGGGRPAGEGMFHPKVQSSVSGALDEAFAAAAKDTDIWATVDGTIQ